MSQENVEVVRQAAEAFKRGDLEDFADSRDLHVVVRLDARWPEQLISGREAVVNWSMSVWETLGPDVHVEEIVDLGDRVLVRWYWKTRGAISGLEEDLRWSEVQTLRDGRVIFCEFFLDRERALKAVGLEE